MPMPKTFAKLFSAALRGVEAVVGAVRALLELTADWTVRIDDILALRPDARVIRWTNLGTDRHGGAFERRLCQLFVFGGDGLVTRWEQFDAEQDTEALARFDEIGTGAPATSTPTSTPSAVKNPCQVTTSPPIVNMVGSISIGINRHPQSSPPGPGCQAAGRQLPRPPIGRVQDGQAPGRVAGAAGVDINQAATIGRPGRHRRR